MTNLSFAKHHDEFFAVGEDKFLVRGLPPGLNLEYFGGGKTSTSTSSVSVPPEVLARYNAVNTIAEKAAGITKTATYQMDENGKQKLDENGKPIAQVDSSGNPVYDYSMGQYTPYSGEFVAPVNQQESQSIQNINNAQWAAQPGLAQAGNLVSQGLGAGTGLVNQSLGTMDAAAQQGQGLYNQSLGTIGSAAGQAANQYGTLYGDISAAQNVGNQYANRADQSITGSTDIAAPLMQQGVNLTNQGLGVGAKYADQSNSFLNAGTQNVDPTQFGQAAMNQYMSPYLNDVVKSQQALMDQQNGQQHSQLQGNAIQSGAFGGDRAGIAQANLAQQQGLANQATLSGILNQGYGQALGAFQQQQGVKLGADQANRAAQQYGQQASAALGQQQYGQNLGAGQNLANIGNTLYGQNLGQGQALAGLGQQQYAQGLGAAQAQAGLVGQNYQMGAQQAGMQQSAAQGLFNQGAQNAAFQGQAGQNLFNMNQQAGMNTGNLALQKQQALLQGNQAALAGGQLMQQTQQAQDQAQYNQFLQQQGYPFQVAQYLANIAEGTGALSGSTTTSTQPSSFFGSDRRLKEDIQKIGKADDGLPIYKFRYKNDPEGLPRIGFMADEVEKKNPDAVKEMGGVKAVDYDKATRPARADGGLVNPDMIELLKTHAMMYNQGNKGLGGVGSGGVGAPGFVPQASLPVGQLMTAKMPAAPQSGLKEAANDASAIAGLAGKGKDAWDWLKKNGPDLSSLTSSSDYAKGGLVPHYAQGGEAPEKEEVDPYSEAGDPETQGYMAKTMRGMSKPGKLAVADPPKSGGDSGLGDIASLASSAAKIIPFFFKDGGLVPRPHKAGGGGTENGNDTGLDPNLNDPDLAAPGASESAGLAGDAYTAKTASGKPVFVDPKTGQVLEDQTAPKTREIPDKPQGRAQAYRQYLIDQKGWAPHAASGAIGNAYWESGGLNHNIVGDNGASIGLFQFNRKAGEGIPFTAWAKENGRDILDPYAQLDFMDSRMKGPYANVYKQMVDSGDARTAARHFMSGYERPNKDLAHQSAREMYADAIENGKDLPAIRAALAQGTGTPPSAKGDTGSLIDKISSKMSDPNVILSILAGLGTMAGSNSRYLGSAILQGLGGGASTYAQLNNQSAQRDIQRGQLGVQQQRVGIEQSKYDLELAMKLKEMNTVRASMGMGPISMDELKKGFVPGLGGATETPKTPSGTKAPEVGLNPPLKPAEAPLPTPRPQGLDPTIPAPIAPPTPVTLPGAALTATPSPARASPETPAAKPTVTTSMVKPDGSPVNPPAPTPPKTDTFFDNVHPEWDPRNASAKAAEFDKKAMEFATQAKVFGTGGDAARMEQFLKMSQLAQQQAEALRQKAQSLVEKPLMMKDGTFQMAPSIVQANAGAKAAEAAATTAATRGATTATTLKEVQPEAGGPKVFKTEAQILKEIQDQQSNPNPGAGSPLGPVAAQPENLAKRRDKIEESELAMRDQFQARQVARARVDNLSKLIENYETGMFAGNKAAMVAAARSAGFDINPGAADDPTLFQQFTKDSMKNIFDDAKALGGRILVTELAGLAKTNSDPDLQPGANAYILGQSKGLLDYEDDYFRDYTKWREQNPTSAYPERFDVEWVKNHSLLDYMDEGKLGVAAKGEGVPPREKLVDRKKYITPNGGPRYWDAEQGAFVKTQPPKRTGTNG